MQRLIRSKKPVPEKQVKLPFVKSLEIALKSIRIRFFRTFITTMSLILAISFYSYIQTNAILISGVVSAQETVVLQKLSQQGYDLPEPGTPYTTTPKERWILFLSLLVCIVGIVNTQLMAVTDRFREIGTMKCLGALDRFVLRLFLIEASLQGLVGSLIGVVLGSAIALSSSFFKFGSPIFEHLDMGLMFITMASAVGLGCFLSILGVLYPALLAAGMQPVEAMRGKD
ncbi:ABC transporter permease [Desulfospira joergensenii]|uniref:ABC transporter permease n=1 Tax=Desulfospira joergensenii TaxID=53329 RepID=UPI0003B7992D|nr:FtsX-like permease family protein [Desulfospira joergensenii]